MTKEKIPEAIRVIVDGILKQQTGPKKWRQQEHAAAVSKAALAFALWFISLPPKAERKDDVITIEGRDSVTWKSFAERYGDCGFGSGNLSQFQQALDDLGASDLCYVKRPHRGVATEDYK